MKARRFPTLPVVLVDDELEFLESARLTLASEGINNVMACQDSRELLPLLAEIPTSVVLLDILMPHVGGDELLPRIASDHPEVQVIIVTAVDKVRNAVRCMKAGACDYLVKPVDDTRLVVSVRRAAEIVEMQNENQALKESLLSRDLKCPDAFADIVTRDEAMLSIFRYIEAVASTPLPVLITGETGVGKEMIAQKVHELSGRPGQLISVNVAGIDGQMFSDMLFGHTKGAFTGANSERRGLIEHAQSGTLFLDEIGDLDMDSQVKLLRLLQDGRYYSLGSDVAKLSDARIVAATNREISSITAERGGFRRDLFYRLCAHHVRVPPLRERRRDIPLLLDHFLQVAANALGKKQPSYPPQLLDLLYNHPFPGNVRELEAMAFDAVSRHTKGMISSDAFTEKMGISTTSVDSDEPGPFFGYREYLANTESLPHLKTAEDLLIDEALRRANGNQSLAARLLGMSRQALNNRLRRRRRKSSGSHERVQRTLT